MAMVKNTTVRPPVKKMHLNTHEAARRTLARLLRHFHSDPNADIQKFRATVYGLNALLSYFQLACDLQIEEKLEQLEELIQNGDNIISFPRRAK